MNKPPKPQKHHYIPQFYLRPWLGDDHKLEEFGRVPPSGQIRSRRRGPESTGFEYNLYTMPGVTDDTKQNIEREFYGVVDRTAAAVRDKLLTGPVALSPQERYDWSRFLVSLCIRNPDEMARMKAIVEKFTARPDQKMREIYASMRQDWQPDDVEGLLAATFPEAPELSAVMASTSMITNHVALTGIMHLHWRVFDTSRVRRKLVTCDRPVVMTGGIARENGHIAIPISPDKLFVATMYPAFAEWLGRWPTGRLVRESNAAQIGQARKHVYAVEDSPIAEVRRGMSKREYMSLVNEPRSILIRKA